MKVSAKQLIAQNNEAQDALIETVGSLGPETVRTVVDGEKWSIGQIVEHIAIVEEGIGRLCSSLLKKARDEGSQTTDGVELSDRFVEATQASLTKKLAAPETVHPSGDPAAVSIAASIERLNESGRRIAKLEPLFEQFNSTSHTFPHPHWGKMTAGEWLSILGAHKYRHIAQIQNALGKMQK